MPNFKGSRINNETKAAFVRRLKHEGKWEEFEQRLNWLLEDTPEREAWQLLRNDPQFMSKATLTDDLTRDEIKFLRKKPPCSMWDTMLWIYDNLGDPDVDIETAPSVGAVFHLRKIKNDSDLLKKFLSDIVTRMLPSQKEIDQKANLDDPNLGFMNRLEQLERDLEIHVELKEVDVE